MEFPLILVIGREANDSMEVAKGIGYFEFNQITQFWNRSMKAIERTSNIAYNLRNRCIQVNNCPVIYADASPISRLNGTYRKGRTIDENLVGSHIQNLLENPLIDRIKLVLISGKNGRLPDYKDLYDGIEQGFAKLKIPVLNVPFFGQGSTNDEMDSEMWREENFITKIIKVWEKQNNTDFSKTRQFKRKKKENKMNKESIYEEYLAKVFSRTGFSGKFKNHSGPELGKNAKVNPCLRRKKNRMRFTFYDTIGEIGEKAQAIFEKDKKEYADLQKCDPSISKGDNWRDAYLVGFLKFEKDEDLLTDENIKKSKRIVWRMLEIAAIAQD